MASFFNKCSISKPNEETLSTEHLLDCGLESKIGRMQNSYVLIRGLHVLKLNLREKNRLFRAENINKHLISPLRNKRKEATHGCVRDKTRLKAATSIMQRRKTRNGQGADGKENTSALLLLKPKRLTCNEAGWRYETG